MATKTKDPRVIDAINKIKSLCRLGIRHNGEFYQLSDVSIDEKGRLFYTNEHKELVSKYIKNIKGLQTARWLNHLVMIDAYDKEQPFKKWISQNYNLRFT